MDSLDILAKKNNKVFNPDFLEGITTAIMPLEISFQKYSASKFDRSIVEPLYSVRFQDGGAEFFQKKPMGRKKVMIYRLSYNQIIAAKFIIGRQQNTALSFKIPEYIYNVMIILDLNDSKRFRFWNYDLNIIMPVADYLRQGGVKVTDPSYDFQHKGKITLTNPLK